MVKIYLNKTDESNIKYLDVGLSSVLKLYLIGLISWGIIITSLMFILILIISSR